MEETEERDGSQEDIFEGYFLSRALMVNFNYLFFPGLVMHEFAHWIACVISGSRVYQTVFWSARGGFVVHRRVRGSSSVFISLAPFFVNNFLAVACIGAALGMDDSILGLVLWWLAFSFAIYSIPSVPDLANSIDAVNRSYHLRAARGGASALAAALYYPLVFAVHYLILLPLLFFARHRTLRIIWFVVLYAAFAGGGFSA